METNLSHNLHYKKTSTKTVTHKQLQGHMVDGILLCTLNTYYYVCPVNSMSSGDAGISIIGNYFTDNLLSDATGCTYCFKCTFCSCFQWL